MDEVQLVLVGEKIRLLGPLTFKTIKKVLAESEGLITKDSAPFILDLSGLTRLDSAGLALLLELIHRSQSRGSDLKICAIPPELEPLIDLYGLRGLFAEIGHVE